LSLFNALFWDTRTWPPLDQAFWRPPITRAVAWHSHWVNPVCLSFPPKPNCFPIHSTLSILHIWYKTIFFHTPNQFSNSLDTSCTSCNSVFLAVYQCLMPIILATWEAEIRRIKVWSHKGK
jgi:hypothetical protein